MRFKDKIFCDNCGAFITRSKKIEKEQTDRRKRGDGYNLIAQCKKCKREEKIKNGNF